MAPPFARLSSSNFWESIGHGYRIDPGDISSRTHPSSSPDESSTASTHVPRPILPWTWQDVRLRRMPIHSTPASNPEFLDIIRLNCKSHGLLLHPIPPVSNDTLCRLKHMSSTDLQSYIDANQDVFRRIITPFIESPWSNTLGAKVYQNMLFVTGNPSQWRVWAYNTQPPRWVQFFPGILYSPFAKSGRH